MSACKSRNYGVSNNFSEYHRKCQCFSLFDVDGIFIRDGEIVGLYEEKYKIIDKIRGDFINTFYQDSNKQAGFLRFISKTIPIWIYEKSRRKWWIVRNEILSLSENPNIDLIKTENRIYISDSYKEIINSHKLIGIFLRTQGEKPCWLESYLDLLSSILNIKKILVNDVYNNKEIFFKCGDINSKALLDKKYRGWHKNWVELGIVSDIF